MSSGMTSRRRWHPASSLLLLSASTAPALVAVRLRDHFDWEDTEALVALGAACAAAAVLAGAIALAWRRRADLAIAYALLAAALVTPVIVLYYLARMWATADYS